MRFGRNFFRDDVHRHPERFNLNLEASAALLRCYQGTLRMNTLVRLENPVTFFNSGQRARSLVHPWVWQTVDLKFGEEVININDGIAYHSATFGPGIGLLHQVFVHLGNDDILRTFILLSVCTKVDCELNGIYPMDTYLPVPPFSHPEQLSLFHVSEIQHSIHLPHACLFGSLGPRHVPCCQPSVDGSFIVHAKQNPYYVYNDLILPGNLCTSSPSVLTLSVDQSSYIF